MDKSPDAFRTISEAAEDLDLPQHVLRFWETRFPQIKPLKRGGGRRYYRPDDVELLRVIKQLLYGEGYTIKGVQKLFKEQGARAVASSKQADAAERTGDAEGEPPLLAGSQDDGVAATARADAARPASLHAVSPADVQALKAALADIIEGERILSLARTS
ncbi:MAG: MerR family transcriptional regulator [Roseiarcus sp.]|jgi:DNA-binding transcriptional MerR regulator